MPEEGEEKINLVHPQRELRVHSNCLKDVTRRSHGHGHYNVVQRSSQWSFTPNQLKCADENLDGHKSVKKLHTANAVVV